MARRRVLRQFSDVMMRGRSANRNVKDKRYSRFSSPQLRVTIRSYDWKGQLMRWFVSSGAVRFAGAWAGGDVASVAAPAPRVPAGQHLADKVAEDAKLT